ncbi:MAG: FecR domain-containing protein [Flavisolibacter sp.]|nr:FecR domain-containing protein [Flavisolibacter sp.]
MNKDLNDNGGQQADDAFRVAYLVAGYISHTLTQAERDELDDWVTASDENMRLFVQLTDEKNIAKGLKERGFYDADKAVDMLKQKIAAQENTRPVKRLPFFAIGIAASLVLLAGLLFFLPQLNKKKVADTTSTTQNDLQPGGNKAILTLSDGKQIVLDTTYGRIIHAGKLDVMNHEGILSYQGQSLAVDYHTLSTPKGGQYQLVLPDGSKVWLNAASSVKFPTTFTGKERKVEITGEAYFEVVHDADKPFIVSKGETYVQVLGTHFNVNAYEDEDALKVTLVEGSVKVSSQVGNKQETVILKPNEQAIVRPNAPLVTNHSPDTDAVIAWKQGLFEFKDAPIEDIMRQVARWYNVDVKYQGKPGHHFNASIKRSVPVSKLFHLLELTDQVHFTIEDKTIIVKP